MKSIDHPVAPNLQPGRDGSYRTLPEIQRHGQKDSGSSKRGLYIGGLLIAAIAVSLALSSGPGSSVDNSQNLNPRPASVLPTEIPEVIPPTPSPQEDPAGYVCGEVQTGGNVYNLFKAKGIDLLSPETGLISRVFVIHQDLHEDEKLIHDYSFNDLSNEPNVMVYPGDLVCKVKPIGNNVRALFEGSVVEPYITSDQIKAEIQEILAGYTKP